MTSPRNGNSSPQTMTTFTVHYAGTSPASSVPITIGVPCPRGSLFDAGTLQLTDPLGNPAPLQTEPLARWSDGSIQWLLVDTVAAVVPPGASTWVLSRVRGRPASLERAKEDPLTVETTDHGVRLRNRAGASLADISFPLVSGTGSVFTPRLERVYWQQTGPVRKVFRLEGRFSNTLPARFVARIETFAGVQGIRLTVRLHNPRRARHRGGLWDLGDPNAILFRSFHIEAQLPASTHPATARWRTSLDARHPAHEATLADDTHSVRIVQRASGGEHWNSPTHVDRHGRIPLSANGYMVMSPLGEAVGDRATPELTHARDDHEYRLIVPEFWEQFPKSVEATRTSIRIGLFPEMEWLHELQPGEQKTHTAWIFTSSGESQRLAESLEWAANPPRVTLPAETCAKTHCPSIASPAPADTGTNLKRFLADCLGGELTLAKRRERIDEFGWRNYGEIHADHEQEHYPGAHAVISHYNNQFDLIYGGILQLARTGDPSWYELFDPLARHVIDIDLYHTTEDRSAYSGGLFWHTDHYATAHGCTHRSYSRGNARPGRTYGGGPGNEHNYTTGLLHYYYLTGNTDARDAVLSLADWVIAMDDGRRSIFAILDESPTGLATATADENYHGPGRGAGNSLNALTDAWTLTHDRKYHAAAETILRRVVHPEEDLASLDLLNAETRWSYTVFLVALAKWLDAKSEANELDDAYAYGQAALLHYARWMAENERPYLDRPEELEYPTSAWAAQELRKANVLRLAARHASSAEQPRFLERGRQLAARAWSDLQRFENRHNARCLSILMTEGAREAWLESDFNTPAPAGNPQVWPERVPFVTQKQKIRDAARSPLAAVRLVLRLMNPRHWPGTFTRYLQYR